MFWGGKQSIMGDMQMAAEQSSVSRSLNGQELLSKRAKTIEMTEWWRSFPRNVSGKARQ